MNLQVSVAALTTTLVLSCGCSDLIPPRPTIGRSAEKSPVTAQSDAASALVDLDPAEGKFEGPWSEWYVVRLGDKVVGMTEIEATRLIDPSLSADQSAKVQYVRREQMIFRSGRTQFIRRLSTTSIETDAGDLRSFQTQVHEGPITSTIRGTRGGAKISINSVTGGQQDKLQLQWPTSTRGLFALEQTLRRHSIEKGETRRLQVLMPSLKSIGIVELKCIGDASVAMIDGTYRVLREIEVVAFADGKPTDNAVVWFNEEGVIEKVLRPGLRLESFRTDRATAEQMYGRRDESEVVVSVSGALPGSTESGITDPAPVGIVDLKPTPLIDSNQSTVTRMSKSFGELSGRDLVSELSQVVRNSLSLEPQGALRPASVIIRQRSGGVIDHAIVLAAVLRAREIPTRVVFGLTPTNANEDAQKNLPEGRIKMELVAWVVALADDQWVSVDPITSEFNRTDQRALDVLSGDADVKIELNKVFRQITDVDFALGGATATE